MLIYHNHNKWQVVFCNWALLSKVIQPLSQVHIQVVSCNICRNRNGRRSGIARVEAAKRACYSHKDNHALNGSGAPGADPLKHFVFTNNIDTLR
jgi:hypothetical protein